MLPSDSGISAHDLSSGSHHIRQSMCMKRRAQFCTLLCVHVTPPCIPRQCLSASALSGLGDDLYTPKRLCHGEDSHRPGHAWWLAGVDGRIIPVNFPKKGSLGGPEVVDVRGANATGRIEDVEEVTLSNVTKEAIDVFSLDADGVAQLEFTLKASQTMRYAFRMGSWLRWARGGPHRRADTLLPGVLPVN